MSKYDGILANIQDHKSLGLCNKGTRAYFLEKGWDYEQYRREGLPAQILADADHPYGRQIAEQAYKRTQKERKLRGG